MNSKTAHIWAGNKFNMGDHVLFRNGNVEFEIVNIHIYHDIIQYDILIVATLTRHVNENELKEC